jgi:hypothetical protein
MSSDRLSAIQQAVHIGTHNFSQTQVQTHNQISSQTETEAASGHDKVSFDIDSSRQNLDTLQRIGQIAGALNATAMHIRETSDSLTSSADIVSRMTGELNRIVKNYPPFSLEDEERKKILMSYISIRKQIEKLTIPTLPPPINEKVEGMWQELFDRTDGRIETPALSEKASDSVVQAAANQLSATGATINRLLETIQASLT